MVVSRRTWARLRLRARRASYGPIMAFALALLAIGLGIATMTAVTARPDVGIAPETVNILLWIDGMLGLIGGGVVMWRLQRVWRERRAGLAGSRMQSRLVFMFGLVAIMPAIVVAVFAVISLNFGLKSWFSDRIRAPIEESRAVAQGYLVEHKKNIHHDIERMANDLNNQAAQVILHPELLSQLLSIQAVIRELSEAVVVNGQGTVVARSNLPMPVEFEHLPQATLDAADTGEIVILTGEKDDRVRAVVKLKRFFDSYLVVGRAVDPEVIGYITKVENAAEQYRRTEEQSKNIFEAFVLIFVVVALLVLLAAVWIGLSLATRLAYPISNLIVAAERVREGDLGARVRIVDAADEIGILGRAFNRMTQQLETQRQGLMNAYRELDERRRFTEAVLTGVTAGVIGLDSETRITLPNTSASELLGIDLQDCIGRPLVEIVPEMVALLDDVIRRPNRLYEAQIRITRARRGRTLLARVGAERLGGEVVGYVVTFDDITELLTAQRTAAWADIARRIAHEIKNPLTPIQLSAERLKRKYLKEITSDPDSFKVCTETIVRQVEDIGRMVDEFSSFARMPQPSLKPENLTEICVNTVFLERSRHPDIRFDVVTPETPVRLRCDIRQIGRALTNVLKNAAESIVGRVRAEGEELPPGVIRLALDVGESQVQIVIEDNGRGLPVEQRERLTEPYVTTREKGTGLGLAIVKKIMEDHGGELLLDDAEGGGARVVLTFRDERDTDRDSNHGA